MASAVGDGIEQAIGDVRGDISRRQKHKDFLLRLQQAWAHRDLDTLARLAKGRAVEGLVATYPQAVPLVERLRILVDRAVEESYDVLARRLEAYCQERGIQCRGRNGKFVVQHLLGVEFERGANKVKVGNTFLQTSTWDKIQEATDKELARIWDREFHPDAFANELVSAYNKIVGERTTNLTRDVRLADVYRLLKERMEKKEPQWKRAGRLVAYYKDEFSADLSKLYEAQATGKLTRPRVRFSAIRDARLAFRVVLPDGSVQLYGFVRLEEE